MGREDPMQSAARPVSYWPGPARWGHGQLSPVGVARGGVGGEPNCFGGTLGAGGMACSRSAGAPGPPAHGDESKSLVGAALGAKLEEGGNRRGRGLAVTPVLWPGASAEAAVATANVAPYPRPAKSQTPLMERGLVSVDSGV